jgi:putative phosphoesterase
MKAVVLADTHIRRGSSRRLPDAVYAELDSADVVLHAGDVLEQELLDELAGFAPVHGVLGNNDCGLAGVLPVRRLEVLEGVRVGMIHDSGPRAGRPGRMHRAFPDADLVIFGHSHAPQDELGVGGQRLFNPGSPTERRAQPRHTFGLLVFRDGALADHRIVPIE